MITNAGSSRAHWFFVCLWYDVCRYLRDSSGINMSAIARASVDDNENTCNSTPFGGRQEAHAIFGATHS